MFMIVSNTINNNIGVLSERKTSLMARSHWHWSQTVCGFKFYLLCLLLYDLEIIQWDCACRVPMASGMWSVVRMGSVPLFPRCL